MSKCIAGGAFLQPGGATPCRYNENPVRRLSEDIRPCSTRRPQRRLASSSKTRAAARGFRMRSPAVFSPANRTDNQRRPSRCVCRGSPRRARPCSPDATTLSLLVRESAPRAWPQHADTSRPGVIPERPPERSNGGRIRDPFRDASGSLPPLTPPGTSGGSTNPWKELLRCLSPVTTKGPLKQTSSFGRCAFVPDAGAARPPHLGHPPFGLAHCQFRCRVAVLAVET